MGLPVPPLREPAALTGIVIAGGGPAGASAAGRLARAGYRVTVLEREKGPAHKVCGEFVSGEALSDLSDLGIDVAALGASPIDTMRLVHRGRSAEARLPFAAAGLSRLVLDEALLQRAAALGAEVHRGVRVRGVRRGAVQTESGCVAAETVMLATGKHELRGHPRDVATERGALIGFKMHLRLRPEQQAALTGYIEVVLFDRGYAGLQMIEGSVANLCLLVERSRFEEQGQDWPSLLASLADEDTHLARRMDGAAQCWARPLSIFRVPYGFIHRAPDGDGIYRLGDQAAVIPSFCGDGMAIALHSAKLAAAAVLTGSDATAYHRAIRRDAGPPVRLASTLYKLTRRDAGRRTIVTAARAWPGLLGSVARHTRVAPP